MSVPGVMLLVAACLGASTANAADGLVVTPYLWVAGFEGTVGAGTPDSGGDADADFGDLWDNLGVAGAMVNASWRRDRWTVFGDWTWAKVESDSPTANGVLYTGASAEVRGHVLQAFAGRDVLPSATGHLDLFAGARYYDLDVDVGLEGGILAGRQASADARWWDAVAGARYQRQFAGRWQVYAQADVGAGGAESSWELIATAGYDFDWGTLVGGWRYLSADYRGDGLRFDATLAGPFLGGSFRF